MTGIGKIVLKGVILADTREGMKLFYKSGPNFAQNSLNNYVLRIICTGLFKSVTNRNTFKCCLERKSANPTSISFFSRRR